MATSAKTIFEDIGAWVKKIFTKTESIGLVALSALNAVAPEIEGLFDLIDPAAAVIANPIITEVQIDLGTVVGLLKSGNLTNLGTFFAAIKANLNTLLTGSHITDPASVTKATGIVSAVVGVLESIAAALGVTV